MLYIKRVVNADVTRQIDLAKDAAKVFFGFDESIPNLQYELEFIDKFTNTIYEGRIAKKGHSVTIPGRFFSYIKQNHKNDDLIVFEKTEDDRRFFFHVFRPSDSLYNHYESLLEQYGIYSGKLKKHTHLIIDEASIPGDEWVNTINNWIKKIEALEGKEERISESVARELHSEWKELLAQNMMNLIKKDSHVICPFTGVEGDFSKLPMLFIASHIKRFADSSLKEKYDINNGLLLTANADALFDKYMITVSEEKKLIFSKYIDEDLKRVLNLVEIIMPEVLTDERMEYMKEHRRIFLEKERDRESSGIDENEVLHASTEGTHVLDSPSHEISHRGIKYEIPMERHVPAFAAEDEETYCVICSSDKIKVNNSAPNSILVGCYKSQKHLQWILQNKLYNIRLGKRAGSMDQCIDDLPSVTHIVLYKMGKHPDYRIFNVKGGRIINGKELNVSGYPNAKEEQDYYVFDIEPLKKHVQINLEELIKQAETEIESYQKGMPIILN